MRYNDRLMYFNTQEEKLAGRHEVSNLLGNFSLVPTQKSSYNRPV